ncbi:hypothetical protein M885DRAFT_163689 [Pelagophyceae sp. CCMP2097]|nr:hypothetical protein M885DRAFT_163689 [Pelagophyceae sp. CCMP2097]
MHAQDDPIRVAAATAAAAHALGGGPAPAAAPPQDPPARFAARPQVCESPRQKKSPRDDADDVMAASSSLSGAGGLASFLASSTSNLDLLSSASFRGPTASAGASASNARGGGRRPRIDGALRLSETLCSLSLDDASWLGDVVDASLNVDTTRTSWNVSPRASRDVLMAMPPPSAFAGGTTPSHAAGGAAGAPARMAAPPPRASFRDFKMSASIDDWGSALAGSSLAGGAGAGAVAFASDHPLAATVDEQVWRLSPRAGLAGHVAPSPPSPARDPMRRSSGTDLAHVTDTSMSLDNVDWDLILKMSHTPRNADGSADTFVRPHGISAIDFDPRSHFSPPDDDITPRAKCVR